MKEKLMILWRIIVAIGMMVITVFVIFVFHELYKESYNSRQREVFDEESKYSDSYVFEYKNNHVRTKEVATNKYISPELSMVFTDCTINDTLTVFKKDNKRGFLDIYTGKIVIPAQYDRAWIFSQGLGGVAKDGKIGFINKKGELVIPFQFNYLKNNKHRTDYLFKDNYCSVIGCNNKHGLIDKTGKWVIEPQYDYINNPVKGYRIIKDGDYYGLMDSTLCVTFPIEYDWIRLHTNGILLTRAGEQKLVSYDGKVELESFVIDDTRQLYYSSGEINDNNEDIYKLSPICVYSTFDGNGLFDTRTNKPITKAIYGNIIAVNKDLFECSLSYLQDGKVLLNSKGEIIP